MAIVQCRAWKCEIERCGWLWMYTPDRTPLRCPSCGSRRWNSGAREVDVHDQRGALERTGNDAAVSVLPKAKSAAKRPRKVQPVRDKLAGRGGSDERSTQPANEGLDQGTGGRRNSLDEDQLGWSPRSPCRHGFPNSFACRRKNGGC